MAVYLSKMAATMVGPTISSDIGTLVPRLLSPSFNHLIFILII